MPKFPEKISVLLGAGDALLARLHKIKTLLADPKRKPPCYSDAGNARVLNNAVKKFPNLPDLSVLDSILPAIDDRYEEFDDFYYTFVDVSAYLNATKMVIEELTGAIAAFQFDRNPVMTEAFLDLTTILVRILLLMGSINERKSLVTVFAALYKKKNSKDEAEFKGLTTFIHSYENPIRTLQQSLDPSVAQALGHALVDLMSPIMAIHNVDQMRKTGTLSITNKPNEMCYPHVTKEQFMIRLSPKLYMWVVYGFLLTPEHFAMPETMDVLRLLLNQSYVAPLYLSNMCYIHSEYELMFSSYKSSNKPLMKQLKKDKKSISELLSQSVQAAMGPKFRRDRRDYIRHELKVLVLLVKDYPGLLGPKIGIIWSCLAMAKEEIFWYFSHRVHSPPKGAKGYQEKLYIDPRISELVYYMEEMATVIRQYSYIIQQYYLEYLCGADLNEAYDLIQKLLQKGASGNVATALNSILQELQNISVEAYLEGTNYSFRALRLNWFRIETWLVSPGCPAGDINSNSELTKRMNKIVHHTKNVDAIEYLLWDYESLHGLVNYGDLITQEIDRCLESVVVAPYLTSWIGLISKFPESVGTTNEEEKPSIGEAYVDIANSTIEKLVVKIGDLVDNIANSFIILSDQVNPAKAAPLITSEWLDGQTKFSVGSNIIPGTESFPKNIAKLGDLPKNKDILASLCGILKSFEVLYVYTQVYSPIVFLKEKLGENFEKFMLKALRIPPLDKEGTVTVQRPSILLKHIEMYRYAMQHVAENTLLDVTSIVQKVLAKLTYHPIFDNENPLAWVHDKTASNLSVEEYPFLTPIVNLYSSFVLQRMEYNAMIYSETRDSFVCKNLKVEEYCSLPEFEALAKLIGPHGIQLIDSKLLDTVTTKLHETKEIVKSNEEDLSDLETFYVTDSCIPYARKLLDIESFTLKGLTIGNCLLFRQLLYRGLGNASEKLTPVLYSSTQCLFNQYKRNIFANENVRCGDILAASVGIQLDMADPALHTVFKSIQSEGSMDLWKLLPYFFASCTFTSVMQNAVYKPSLDIFLNNAHVLADTFYTTMVLARSTNDEEEEDYETIRTESLVKYIEVASIILTRLLRISVKDLQKKLPFASLQSSVIFLDLFVKKSGLSKWTLDRVTPYALMRSLYHDIYLADE